MFYQSCGHPGGSSAQLPDYGAQVVDFPAWWRSQAGHAHITRAALMRRIGGGAEAGNNVNVLIVSSMSN
ncbi:unnamed protein product [Ixodes pacificus]